MKPETLIRNLQQSLDSASGKNLPITIIRVDGFGSLFYGKPNPNDLDCIVLYTMTEKQKREWDKFAFSIWFCSPNHREFCSLVWKYYIENISLQDILKIEDVSTYLREKEINSDWLSYFSCSEILNDPYGMFCPSLEKLVTRMIKKGIIGLSCMQIQDIKKESLLYTKNFVFLWSPEKTNIQENISKHTEIDKISFTKNEIANFNEQLSNFKDVYGTSYDISLSKLKNEVLENGISINLQTLENGEECISLSGDESYDVLVRIATQLRQRLKNLTKKQKIIDTISRAIYNKNKYRCSVEELISFWILKISKQLIKREELESFCMELELPIINQ